MSLKVTIKPANASGRAPQVAKGLPVTLEFPGKTAQTLRVDEVKKALAAKFPRFTIYRQKLSLPNAKPALADEKTVAEVVFDANKGAELAKTGGEAAEVELWVKDLGPQISWQTVFVIEYIGPLFIHPLIYHLPKVFFRSDFQHSRLQQLVYALVLAHYVKRELETLFVHRFSHATMPARNIVKNSAHYWILSGLFLAGAVYGPWYSAPRLNGTLFNSDKWLLGWGALFVVSELFNLSAHLTLRALRPAGTKTRGIPRGGLFELVTCPNYFAETMAWVAITAVTASPIVAIFLVVSVGQMVIWAAKKHRAYKKEFGDKYPRGRKVMFPFIW
ncbi:hypothetical protein DL93DRAFT_1379465 [Clavulina sp. PMI_390]|nr:hypothetical protein DL93DRAFT_1379465 [Clavulina sp. PMI_390]